jgi:hypothetical protein
VSFFSGVVVEAICDIPKPARNMTMARVKKNLDTVFMMVFLIVFEELN